MGIAPTFTARTVLSNFGPWIVYGLAAATGHQGLAYLGGLTTSLFQIASQRRVKRPKIMDGVSLLFFLAGAVSILVFHSSLFPHSGSVLIWSALAVVAWWSLGGRSPSGNRSRQNTRGRRCHRRSGAPPAFAA